MVYHRSESFHVSLSFVYGKTWKGKIYIEKIFRPCALSYERSSWTCHGNWKDIYRIEMAVRQSEPARGLLKHLRRGKPSDNYCI